MTIPMTDLFRFVNAEWLDTHEIPSDKASDGSFYQLRDTAEADVHAIMQANPDTRAGRLFASFMDTAALNAAGVEPIRGELDQVHGAGTILLFPFLGQAGWLAMGHRQFVAHQSDP